MFGIIYDGETSHPQRQSLFNPFYPSPRLANSKYILFSANVHHIMG